MTIADLSLGVAVGVSGAPGATFSHEYRRRYFFVVTLLVPPTMMLPDDSSASARLLNVPFSAAFELKVVSATPADE